MRSSISFLVVIGLSWVHLGSCEQFTHPLIDSPEDEKDCSHMPFKEISEYRVFSNKPMSWVNANGCCEMRGMILYTPEVGDEPRYMHVAIGRAEKKLGDLNRPYWTSGKWNVKTGKYLWHFGKEVGANSIGVKSKFVREMHIWKHGDAEQYSADTECVGMEPEVTPRMNSTIGHISLIKRNCNEKRYFVCQIEPQIGGKDLDATEVEFCEKSTLDKFSDMGNGMFLMNRRVRWKVARYCCQVLGMSLVGNFMDRNNEVFEALLDLLDYDKKFLSDYKIWTSLNAICKPRDFRWVCGGNSPAPKWRAIPEDDIFNPDNYALREDCGEFFWVFNDPEPILQGNDLNCDFKNNFICDATPPCPLEKQFPCPKMGPRRVDVLLRIDSEKNLCKTMQYKKMGSSTAYSYFISAEKMSWSGAKMCIKGKNRTQVSFQDKDEMEFLTGNLNSDPKTQVWNTATSWKKTGNKLRWPDDTPVDPSVMHTFHTHDNISPICGKTVSYGGKVAVMTEDCTKEFYYMYKTPSGSENSTETTVERVNNGTIETIKVPVPVDPFIEFNLTRRDTSPPCLYRSTAILAQEVCATSALTIQHPNSAQLLKTSQAMTGEERHKMSFQNRKLREIVIEVATEKDVRYRNNPAYAFRLFGIAAAVYIVQCPDVPKHFILDASRYFHRIHYWTSQGRTELLNQAEYSWIKKSLNKCVRDSNYINFRTDECGEWLHSVNTCNQFICPDSRYQFNITKYDPMVEIMWKIFELSHGVCFQFFQESYRMFHKYSQAIMDLWSDAIRLRMKHQVRSNKFWERILGPSYELHLINMDRCNHAVLSEPSNLHYRLHISTLPNRTRLLGGN